MKQIKQRKAQQVIQINKIIILQTFFIRFLSSSIAHSLIISTSSEENPPIKQITMLSNPPPLPIAGKEAYAFAAEPKAIQGSPKKRIRDSPTEKEQKA